MWRNLAIRQNNGFSVSLDWNDSPTHEESIRVIVKRLAASESFTLYPPRNSALDCFYHPYAYAAAALNGKSQVTV